MKTNEIIMLEEISMNAHPALFTEIYDRWILRYANGYTYRANSISPLYLSSVSIEDKIEECEKRYYEKGLPCIYKLTEAAEKGLDSALERRGYEKKALSKIYVAELKGNYVENTKIRCTFSVDDRWINDFIKLDGINSDSDKGIAIQITKSINRPVICASAYEDAKFVACGLGIIERGYVGLFDIRVDENFRRKGYGSDICKEIMRQAKLMGINKSYLQVSSTNNGAINMYENIGYKLAYDYWYRVKENK